MILPITSVILVIPLDAQYQTMVGKTASAVLPNESKETIWQT
jgi:hypothetical protein